MGNANSRFFHGPGINNWDLGLQKNTKIRESKSVQFRAEFFNAMGHAQFSNPSGSFTSSNFRARDRREGRPHRPDELEVPLVALLQARRFAGGMMSTGRIHEMS